MREKDLKAFVHGALALLAIAEAFNCKSKTRKTLAGCCAGWHLHSTVYHALYEKEHEKKLDKDDSKS